MRKVVFVFILFFLEILGVFAQNKQIEFSIFSREDCVNCIRLEKFIEKNMDKFINAKPKFYDIDKEENYEIFEKYTSLNNTSKITPIILIGNDLILGYQDDEITGEHIIKEANELTKSSYFEDYKKVSTTMEGGSYCNIGEFCEINNNTQVIVKVPFLGKIDLKEYSLFFLSVILGFVDGFNPCAMWVLVMFVSILSQTGSRKKMFQVAGIFVIAEAIMYFMILNVWYKTWNFIKLDNIITPIIGMISAGAGAYFIYEFFTNKNGECKVVSSNQKKKTIDKIKYVASKPMTIGVFFMTIFIAFGVNIVEFACSIGIPQAFTKLLELSNVGFLTKQMYILIYTFFYMIDDFVVFGVAIYAMSYLGVTTKYTRYCLLIGGILMLILGYFFLFDPVTLKMLIS